MKTILNKNNTLMTIRQSLFLITMVVVVVMVFIHSLLLTFIFFDDRLMIESDFPTFYASANIVRDGLGEKLYDFDTQGSYQDLALMPSVREEPRLFKYLPFSSLIFLPFTYFSFFRAYKIFLFINWLLILLSMVLLTRIYPTLKKQKIYWLMMFSYYPFVLTMLKGQISSLVLVVMLPVINYLRKNDLKSGLFYSMVLLKPQFYLSGLLFFLVASNNKWKFLKGVIVGSSVWVILSMFISGVGWFRYYFDSIFLKYSMHGSVLKDMFNLRSFFAQFVGDGKNALYLLAATYIIALIIFMRVSRKLSIKKLFFVLPIFTTVLSPHTLPYDSAMIFISIATLLSIDISKQSRKSIYSLILVVLFLFVTGSFYMSYGINALVVYLVGLVILLKHTSWHSVFAVN